MPFNKLDKIGFSIIKGNISLISSSFIGARFLPLPPFPVINQDIFRPKNETLEW